MRVNYSFYYIYSFLFLALALLYINLYPIQSNLSPSIQQQQITLPSTTTPTVTSTVTESPALNLLSMTSTNTMAKNFQANIVNPILIKLNLYSPAASNLLLGTAIQESFIGRLSKNIFQISLSTAKDINTHFLTKHPNLENVMNSLYDPQQSLNWNLNNNVAYEVAMARVIYLNANQPLPSATDTEALGKFWKINYNTYCGKGTAQEFATHFQDYLSINHQSECQFRT